MSKNNPLLETLVDPLIPQPIEMWPVTIGWKVLAFVIFACIAVAFYQSLKIWKKNKYRRQAVARLKHILHSLDSQSFTTSESQQLNRILKHTAATTYGNTEVASLSGIEWSEYLCETSVVNDSYDLVARWQANFYSPQLPITHIEFYKLIEWSIDWVKDHKVVK